MTDLTNEELKDELRKAYRALRGIYGNVANGQSVNPAVVAYHSPTLGAAMRFVEEGALDGSKYFIGKPVEVLYKTLEKYND